MAKVIMEDDEYKEMTKLEKEFQEVLELLIELVKENFKEEIKTKAKVYVYDHYTV